MNLKIGTKMALSFGVIIALILFMTIHSLLSLQDAKDDLVKINEANARMALADDIVIQYKSTVSEIRAYIAYGDDARVAKVDSNFKQVITLEKDLLSIARTEKKQEVQALIDKTTAYKNTIMTEYISVAKDYNAALIAGDAATTQKSRIRLNQIAKDVATQVADIEKITDDLSIINGDIAKGLIKESIVSANNGMMISTVISLLVLLFGSGIAIVLTKNIRRPVIELTTIADQYAKGDLRNNVQVKSSDEIGQLANSIRTMHNRFVEMITNIRSASEQLATTSEAMAASTEQVTASSIEISDSMQGLAQEAETGNHFMIEVSQSLVQLSSLIQMAKVKANHTCDISEQTLLAAENGRLRVDESVNKMDKIKRQAEKSSQIIGELNEYSKQISQITDTITKLAKQTNLLALNAAIEAARAGEHGRGFAVVAEEVRKLAEQSDQGAHEITALVAKITEKTSVAVATMAQNVVEVTDGVSTVNEAGASLDRILEAVKQTTTEIRAIGDLTSEEVANSEQIIKVIDHLATVIETVTTNSEEVTASTEEQSAAMQAVAASAEETSAMAQHLEQSVAKFHL